MNLAAERKKTKETCKKIRINASRSIIIFLLALALCLPELASAFDVVTVDDDPSPGTWAGVGQYSDIAIDSAGNVHISYHDNYHNDLKYATNATGVWEDHIIGNGSMYEEDTIGRYTSIALDSNDHVHISYKSEDGLKYKTNASGSWQTEIIDEDAGDSGDTSIAVDSTDHVHVSYYNSTDEDLMYAVASDAGWDIYSLESYGDVGLYNSLALDSLDQPHISYTADGVLKHAFRKPFRLCYRGDLRGCFTTFSIWYNQVIDDTNYFRRNAIAIDSNDSVHVSYYDSNDFWLNCANNMSGIWETEENIGADGGETLSRAGEYNAIAVDWLGNVHISYSLHNPIDEPYLSLIPKYITNKSGAWESQVIDDSSTAGKWTSIAIDGSCGIHVSFTGEVDSELRYAYQEDTCSIRYLEPLIGH